MCYLFSSAIPVRTDLSSTRSFTWGSPLTLNCSYQPGVYPDGYNLTWMITISRSTRTIIEQAQSAPFSINSNAHELSVQFYTPLLEASYQCKVIVSSLTPSLYYGNIITVSTNEGMYTITIKFLVLLHYFYVIRNR